MDHIITFSTEKMYLFLYLVSTLLFSLSATASLHPSNFAINFFDDMRESLLVAESLTKDCPGGYVLPAYLSHFGLLKQ